MAKKIETTDAALVEQFNNGSIEAFEELISRYQSKVYNLGLRFTKNTEDAEEVLNDVYTTLYRKLKNFEGKAAFSSWIYRIIVNASFMKLRKNKQTPTVSVEDLSPAVRVSCFEGDTSAASRTDNMSSKREMQLVIQAAISKLPEEYRSVFILRDVDGLSNEETSESLNISVAAVKSRLHRSRLMLRKKLQVYYDDYTGSKPAVAPEFMNSGWVDDDHKMVANG